MSDKHLVEIINHRILHIPYSVPDCDKEYDVDHDMFIPMSEVVSWDIYLDYDGEDFINCCVKLDISLKNGQIFKGLSIYWDSWSVNSKDRSLEMEDKAKQVSKDFVDSNQEYLNDVQSEAFRLLLANKMIDKNVR